MKIGILSDTHSQLPRTQVAVQTLREAGADALVHCGDIVAAEIVMACSSLPCYYVFGNHDEDSIADLQRSISDTAGICLRYGGEVELSGKRVAITHGHMRTDVRRLLAARPDYLLTGHSHLRQDWREGNTRRINPGALYDADEFTVALLDLRTDEVRFFTLCDPGP